MSTTLTVKARPPSWGPVIHRTWGPGVLEEHPTPGGPLDPLVAHLAALNSHGVELQERCPELVIPDRTELRRNILRYSGLAPDSLHEALETEQDLSPTFEALGSRLARIHDIAPASAVPRQPPVRPLEAPGTVVQGPLREALSTECTLLRLATEVQEPTEPPVLLHGRFSTGSVQVRRNTWQLLSGVEQWSGPREGDLGYLLGDLVELATEGVMADRRGLTLKAFNYATATIQGYGIVPSRLRLTAWTANRLVNHLMLNAEWRAQNRVQLPTETEWLASVYALRSTLEVLGERL